MAGVRAGSLVMIRTRIQPEPIHRSMVIPTRVPTAKPPEKASIFARLPATTSPMMREMAMIQMNDSTNASGTATRRMPRTT